MPFFSRSNAAEAVWDWPVLCARIRQLMQLSKYDRAIQLIETTLEEDKIPADFPAQNWISTNITVNAWFKVPASKKQWK